MMLISKPGTLSIYAKLFRHAFIFLELLIVFLFIFEIEYYEDSNQFLIEFMMKEYALMIFLLSLEIVIFARIHLYFGTPKLKIIKNVPKWKEEE
jgi:hypothetical protein